MAANRNPAVAANTTRKDNVFRNKNIYTIMPAQDTANRIRAFPRAVRMSRRENMSAVYRFRRTLDFIFAFILQSRDMINMHKFRRKIMNQNRQVNTVIAEGMHFATHMSAHFITYGFRNKSPGMIFTQKTI